MKAAIYSRKSKFTGKGESVENQIEICRDYISKYYEEYTETIIYEDEGFSGKDFDRPNFKSLLQDAREKKFTMLFCYRLDRVSRNISDFSSLINELNNLGIGFVSIKEQFDTSTPIGRAMMYMASVFSQLERETIAERIKDNMYELAKTGRWLGGVTPTGYESAKVMENREGKVKARNILSPKTDELYTVAVIYNKFLEYKSVRSVEIYLENEGFRTKNMKNYSRYTIKNILENPVYAKGDMDIYRYFAEKNIILFEDKEKFNGEKGLIAFNKTMQKKNQANIRNSMDKWILSLGEHKGVINGKDWVEVQALLANNKNKRLRKPRKNNALLSGVLLCGCCGSYMRPKLYSVKEGTESKYSYLCELKEKTRGEKCALPNIKGEIIEGQIKEILFQLLNEDIYVNKKSINMNPSTKGPELLEKKYNLNQKRLQNLAKRIKDVDDEVFSILVKEIEDIKEENRILEMKLAEEYRDGDINAVNMEQLSDLVLENYLSTLFEIKNSEIADILKVVITRVKAGENDIVIELAGEGKKLCVDFPSGKYSKCYVVTMSPYDFLKRINFCY